MLRIAIRLLALISIAMSIACSEDESASQGASGAGAGGRGAGGSAGGAGAGAGGAAGGATYTVAQTCEMFAAVACAKAAECGLVLDRTDAGLLCLDCTEGALAIIATGCAEDLTGSKDAAALDRCLANMAASSCNEACSDADTPGCEVIDELSGDEDDDPVVCDEACASG